MRVDFIKIAKLMIAFLIGGTFTGTLSFVSRGMTFGFDHYATVVSLPPITVGGISATLIVFFFIRSRELIREAERAKLLDAFESAPQGISLWDAEDRFVWCNEYYQKLHPDIYELQSPHMTYEDFIRTVIANKLIQVEDLDLEELVAERVSRFKDQENVWEDFTKSGQWILVNRKILPDGNTIIFHTDITERKQSEERFSKAFYDNPMMQSITRLEDGVMVDVNTAWLDALGYDRKEAIGNSAESLGIMVDFSPHMRSQLIGQIRKEEGYVNFEGRLRCKNGNVKQFNVNADLIDIGGDEHMLLASEDITERKRSEEALRMSEARFENFAEAGADRFWETDKDHRYTYISPSLQGTYIKDAKDILGKTRWQALNVDITDENWCSLIETMDAHQPFRDFRSIDIDDNGEVRHIVSSGLPIFDDEQNFLGYRGMTVEETEDVLREEQLRQSQKMEAVGQLSSGIAHDFNNLLMAALGNVEYIEEEVGDQELKDHAGVAKRAILRGAELTQRLLAFSRVQALDPKKTDIGDLLKSLQTLFRRTLPESIDINWSLPPDLWSVKVDQGQLESAILNLVINSRDAMLAGGTLAIGCENVAFDEYHQIKKPDLKVGEYVAISVADTGTGIRKDHLNKIIDPFFTTKGVGEGSGLGLSMTYGFVSQSDGFVDIESEPGAGAKITLYLPRDASKVETAKVALLVEEEIPMGCGESILVIEDEEDVREITISQLKNLGYEVIDGGDGRTVLDNCKPNSCAYPSGLDLVLSDVILPNNTSGPKLIELVKECNPMAKALLMTGYTEEDIIRSAEDGQLYPVLGKPFTKGELARHIAKTIGGKN